MSFSSSKNDVGWSYRVYDKTPSARLNFAWNLIVLWAILVSIFLTVPTQKDVINGHFANNKQTRNEV